MTLQVLISTMFEKDYSLLERMNVQSNCVIVNQTYDNSVIEFVFKGHNITWINSKERGLSKSRNLALKYANADILLLADNDEIFREDYDNLILNDFAKNKKADLICFNIESIDNKRSRYINKKNKKLSFLNVFKYGSARIGFRRNFLDKFKIKFNENFGAGTENGGGEDSLFLNDFLKNGGLCFSSPVFIADIDDSKSTWFNGYNEKYFFNLGKFLYVLTPKNVRLISFLVLLKRFKHTRKIGFFKALKSLNKGIKFQKSFKNKN